MASLKLKIASGILCLISFSHSAYAIDRVLAKPAKPCPQTRGTDLIFPKRNTLEIISYDQATKTFTAVSTKLPDEGEFRVTLGGLADSIRQIKKSYDAISHNPASIVGNSYMTQENLFTLTDPEIEARRGCR